MWRSGIVGGDIYICCDVYPYIDSCLQCIAVTTVTGLSIPSCCPSITYAVFCCIVPCSVVFDSESLTAMAIDSTTWKHCLEHTIRPNTNLLQGPVFIHGQCEPSWYLQNVLLSSSNWYLLSSWFVERNEIAESAVSRGLCFASLNQTNLAQS